MSRSEKNIGEAGDLFNPSQYEHAILVSDSVLSKIELFILTGFSVALYVACFKDYVFVVDNLRITGFSLYLFVLARILGKIFWGVKIESIFIVRELGLQTTTVYHSNFKSSKFIPWHSINDVVINEAIVMQKVIFYLAILVRGSSKDRSDSILPIFVHSRPRLTELKKIYRSVQLILRE